MAITQIESSRNVVVIDSVQQFRIVTVCIEKGALPDPGIFVHQMMDTDDPAEDVFIRVSEIADFEQYLDDRVAAVIAGAEYWRSYTLTKFYTDIEVANAAKTAIQDRIDELVSGYDVYVTNFLTASDIVDLPTGEDTLLEALNSTYNTAYDTYGAAVTTEAAAQVAKDDADTALTDSQTSLQNAQTIYDSAGARRDEMVAAEAAMSVFNTSAATTISAVDLFKQQYDAAYPTGDPAIDADVNNLISARDDFNEDRNDNTVALGAAQAAVANHIGLMTDINTLILAPVQSDYTTAEENVRTTTLALAEAEAATVAAYAALETAYNNAKDVCSSWTPDAGKTFPPIS